MQSRVFNVHSDGDRRGFRPMAVGEWTDEFGLKRSSGMADLLAQPRINVTIGGDIRATVPLWIECKSGRGRLTGEQELFRDYVVKVGAYHIMLRDSAEELLAWFKKMGVRR